MRNLLIILFLLLPLPLQAQDNTIPPLVVKDVLPRQLVKEIGRGTLSDFAWKPDGTLIAVSGSLGIYLYTPGFRQLAFFPSPYVNVIAWHPDGSRLSSGGTDGSVFNWTITENQGIFSAVPTFVMNAGNSVTVLKWGVDGQVLAISHQDTVSFYKEFRSETSFLDQMCCASGSITDFAWRDTSSMLTALTGNGGMIQDAQHGSISSTLFDPDVIKSVAWSPDGNYLVTGNTGGGIQIFDYREFNPYSIATLAEHTAQVNSLAWSPDGKWLASASGHQFEDSEIRLWDAVTYQPVSVLPGTAAFKKVAWRPHLNELTVLGEDNIIRRFNPITGEVLGVLQGFSNAIEAIAWSPDGQEIATASDDGFIRIWHTKTGEPIASLQGHTRGANAVAWSPNGLMLASAGWDNTVRVWMRPTGKVRAVMTAHIDRVWAVAWSPDGQMLASVSRDSTLRIWNPYTGKQITSFFADTAELTSIVWTPDGTRVAAGSDSGAVWVWEVATGMVNHVLEGHNLYVWSLVWQPNTNRLISSSWFDGTMRVWDMTSGSRIQSLNTQEISMIAASPGGTYLVSASSNGLLRFWDMENYNVLSLIDTHADDIYSVAWHPDGSMIASTGTDGIIKLWGG